jgi:hypothetical protein
VETLASSSLAPQLANAAARFSTPLSTSTLNFSTNKPNPIYNLLQLVALAFRFLRVCLDDVEEGLVQRDGVGEVL